ncbi:MAG: hypothetical protein AB1428_06700 [Bacteroidota bacterium]
MVRAFLLCSIAFLFAPIILADAPRAVSRDEYLAYATAAAERGWNAIPSEREQWKKSIDLNYVFGYNPPGNDLYLAALSANLYELTRNPKYLERVKSLLLYYGRYREAYPPEFRKSREEFARGIPALPNIFTFGKYVRAYEVLQTYGSLSRAERDTIEGNIAGSADFLITFQEWGPMNRAMLRAESIAYAAKVLTSHPNRTMWEMYGKVLGDDSWNHWEIEDATGYHAVWLYALLSYACDIREDESVFHMPVMHYYFDYFLSLMSPAGFIPDFGDADWQGGWERFIPFFEKGGAVYKDPRYRWAAARLFRRFVDPSSSRPNVFIANVLSDACRWADFSVQAQEPATGSQEVLEDVVGKKVVFRNGWDSSSTYLLYNYRDIGDGGWLPREYLRTTIPVEEEKMHHGHSDENSIALLMKNGSVLLHDGGYRDYMPSGPFGAYRADYYHNRLTVRDGKIALGQKHGEYRFATPNQSAVPGQSLLEFFRNSGAYRDVSTRNIDFQSTRRVDMTRTRVIDEHLGYEADRVVTYLKELDWFVIVDVVRFRRPGYLTMATLWHTRQILSRGEGWYDTAYDSLRHIDVRGGERLLIVFPRRAQLIDGFESQPRYYQREQTIYQMIGRHGYQGDLQTFVTILIPHDAAADPRRLVDAVQMVPVDRPETALALMVRAEQTDYLLGLKLDLEEELIRDWRRPMYTYESGRTRYGDYETDGHFLIVRESADSTWYSVSGATKVSYRGKVLHEQTPVRSFLNFDGTPDLPGVGKLRRWEGEVGGKSEER